MASFWAQISVKWTTWPQWLANIEVSLLSFSVGLCGGWTSPYLAKLTGPDSELPVTDDEASWIASLIQMLRIAGAVVGAVAVTYFGSKCSVFCTGLPVALNWILLIIADSVECIYAARCLQGIAMGMLYGTFPLYVGEISHPSIRGAIIALIMNAQAVGFLVGNVLGDLATMGLYSLISLVPTAVFLVLFVFLPDSPHYLTSRNRIEGAAKAIVWYQRDADVNAEMDSLKKFVQSKNAVTVKDTFHELNIPRNRRALVIVNVVVMLVQLGGPYSISYYMEIILKRAGVGMVIDPGVAVIIVGVISIAGSLLTMNVTDKFGRKIVLGGSAGGLMICFLLLAAHYILIEQGYSTPVLEWFPVVLLIVTSFFLCVGIGPVPSTIVSETFPPHTKSIAACTVNITSGLCAFISTKTYLPMVDAMPDQYVFIIYGLLMGALVIYTFIKLPETKGKSLQEIQEMLKK